MSLLARAWTELAAAVGALTVARGLAATASPAVRAAALAHYPAVGLVAGAVAATAAMAAAAIAPALAGPVGVALLAALGGARGVLPAAAAAVRLALAWALPLRLVPLGVVVAPMLGAWAVVVQCHGGVPAPGHRNDAQPIGRARFREFGWASVVAFGVTLGLAEAVGLVLVVAAALVTLAVRLASYRRLGGLTGELLVATRELVETVVLAALLVLAQFQR
jgi:cobalamin synthase